MASVFKSVLPTFNRIVVRKIEQQLKTKSGIILGEAQKETTAVGKVVFAGPGNLNTKGTHIPLVCSIGDHVLLPEFGGTKITVQGEELFIYRDSEIIGIYKTD